MPNAKDAAAVVSRRVLVLGDTGSGKTTQFLTLPGKKYTHLFDPNALLSLKGYDVDYDEYLPTAIRGAIQSLKKETGGDAPKGQKSEVYRTFENEFNERLENGFYDQYDWIGFDSATTLLDLMMDRVLSINGRLGTWPLQDDWGPQMIAFTNICRTLAGAGKNIYMTGHMQNKEDRKHGTQSRVPMMTGQLAQKIPLLFTDIFGFDSDKSDDGKIGYFMHTVRDREFTVIRTAIKGLEPVENVTIDWKQQPAGQGLGGILSWAEKNG